MFAIVETGGKQYQVEEGRYVDVELLEGEKDSKIVFDKVVMLVNGKKSKVSNIHYDIEKLKVILRQQKYNIFLKSKLYHKKVFSVEKIITTFQKKLPSMAKYQVVSSAM